MKDYCVQGVKWESAKTEKDLKIADNVVVSIEKLGSKIQSVTIMAQDHTLKIVTGDYGSDGLKLFTIAPSEATKKKVTVIASKGGDQIQATRDTMQEAEEKKYDLECDGWKAEIIETEERVKIDIISGKEEDFDIPF